MATYRESENDMLALQKRDPEEVMRDEIVIANMYFQGVALSKMTAELKKRTESPYKIGVQRMGQILKDLNVRWQEANVIKLDFIKNKELAKLDALEDEYWRGWHRSMEDRMETMKMRGMVDNKSVWKKTKKKIKRDGATRYLEGVERCIEKRCRLLGLYAPLRISAAGVGGGILNEEYSMPIDEIRKRLIAVIKNTTNLTINVTPKKEEELDENLKVENKK